MTEQSDLPNMNDSLLTHLIELQHELEKEKIPAILGGGMSLFLRLQYLHPSASSRYPFTVETRATNDLDLFLTGDLIVNFDKIKMLRQILDRLRYTVDPKAKNFQFIKNIKLFGQQRQVRVDLLSAPPIDIEMKNVEVKKPRIKPVGAKGIHAYLTEEARGIEIGKLKVAIPFGRSEKVMITIPSAYNSIILKLHAFNDRKDETDPKSDQGRHHASDIFATVTRMEESDWTNARSHFNTHLNSIYMKRAVQIQQESFSARTAVGVLRLQENESYRRNRATYNRYLEQFVRDMADLFQKIKNKEEP